MPASIPIHELGVDVAGGRLAVFRLGAERPTAPLVVAIHGITANSRSWLAVARALDGRANLIAPDLRGRGASNALPPPYGMAGHTADVLALLDRLEVAQAVLVGHSLGAYIVASFAATHPSRVQAAVLVDGGLRIPGSEGVDPQEFAEELLAAPLARLQMTFASRGDYHAWWRAHPAIAHGDVSDADLVAYADHDLIGSEPELRSSVAKEAVRADFHDVVEAGAATHRLEVRTTMLCAPRGLLDDPNPLQPLEIVEEWAAEEPPRRSAALVPDVNHYTITFGSSGASVVAATIAASLPG
jgi:pimeloyl-ACP methyl ester carboxylesterase